MLCLKLALAVALGSGANAFQTTGMPLRHPLRSAWATHTHTHCSLSAVARNNRYRSSGVSAMQLDPVVANMVIGAVSGTVSNMAVFPLDLAKTKMQTAKGAMAKAKYSSLTASLATIAQEEGASGLFAGSVPVLIGGAPESALQLAAHSWMIAMMVFLVGAPDTAEGDLPLVSQILAGAVGGCATLIATNPMEILRLRAANGDRRGVVAQVQDLGLQGLFDGCEATLLRDVPFSTLYFPLFCNFKLWVEPWLAYLQASNAATGATLLAGFGAGAVASYLTTPMDVIKTRVQSTASPKTIKNDAPKRLVMAFATSEDDPPTGMAGVKAVAVQIVAKEGWAELMCGSRTRVMKLAPNMAITLVLYESAQALLSPFMK